MKSSVDPDIYIMGPFIEFQMYKFGLLVFCNVVSRCLSLCSVYNDIFIIWDMTD